MYQTCKNFVERIANIGTDTNYNALQNRKIRIANTIAYIGLVTFMFYLVIFGQLHFAFVIINSLGICLLSTVVFLNYKGKHLWAYLVLCIDLSFLTVLFAYIFGKTSLAEYFLLVCAILPLFFFDKKRETFALFLFVICCYLGCLLIFEYTEAVAQGLMNSFLAPALRVINILTIFSLLFMVVRLFKEEQNKYAQVVENQNDELTQKHEEILLQKEEIETQSEELTTKSKALQVSFEQIQDKNKEITSSINYARRIQGAILPVKSEISTHFLDFFLLFRPRDIVSGDFYWFTEKNNRKIIAVADCTGHGVPGAFMSMVGSSLLDKIIRDDQITETGKILIHLHLSIRLALKQANSESRDGMDMTICSVDNLEQKLYFSGAKNPLYYVQNQEMKIIKGDKFPIGGHQHEEERIFATYEISLQENDIFYLFSDGYQDQFGGIENRKFMTKNFRKLLFEHHQKPLSNQKQILENTLDNWINIGNEKQTDDILILGFKI